MTLNVEFLKSLTEKYGSYVESFCDSDGKLPRMMDLKRTHTLHVVENAKAIAAGEGFDERTSLACEAAALLHDTGRYEQIRTYNTFRDSESVDHAKFSYDIVREKGWLDALDEKDAILEAVRVHNMRLIPQEVEGDLFASTIARVVRDADKLDIFRVLEDEIATNDWKNDCKAFWDLPVMAEPNTEIIRAIREKSPVNYQDIKTLADFILIQVGWIHNELNFKTSQDLCKERNHLEFRRNFLHQISSSDEIDDICKSQN